MMIQLISSKLYIFGSDSFDAIAEQNNLYTSQLGAGSEWTPTLTMGIHKLPYLSDYWSQHPLLGAPGLTKYMPRDRFKAILRYLHLNDNTQALPRDDPNYMTSCTRSVLCSMLLGSTPRQRTIPTTSWQ